MALLLHEMLCFDKAISTKGAIWNMIDFPDPVGMLTKTSCLCWCKLAIPKTSQRSKAIFSKYSDAVARINGYLVVCVTTFGHAVHLLDNDEFGDAVGQKGEIFYFCI